MSIQISPVIATRGQGNDRGFSAKSLDLRELGDWTSPVAVLDDFRVKGRPFGPHPHAGFSAVTYVLEDSEGALRNRDSLGNDIVMGPGGIVWTQAGSGVIHEETTAETNRALHGLQIFVNLSAKNKLVMPQVFQLAPSEVPEWCSDAGDRVRVVVGSFESLSSPLVPAEPFNLLDVEMRQGISFDLENRHNALVYVSTGTILVRADGRAQKVSVEQAVALHGSGGRVTFATSHPAHFLILSGAQIHEPALAHGPFIMNERSQIEDAFARYRAGAMGHLEAL